MKPTKETLETLRGICIKNWNIYCRIQLQKNWEKHLRATTNYNRVFTWLEKNHPTKIVGKNN